MLKFYYSGAPNPMKVALFLEESGLPYEPIPVDTRKAEQHKPEYLAINPNAKVPAIVDGDVTMFDSNAILLYLAEKTKEFLPENTPKARGELLSWLMFVASGVGPFAGQSVHFRGYAPEKIEYAINRYMYEALGLGAADSHGTRRGGVGEIPEPKAAGRRDQRTPCGAARDCAQRQAQVQDRDGRRGAPGNVRPSYREGGIT